jgi:dipeptidyl aminopeptidase/acylaminoacyl peptidase
MVRNVSRTLLFMTCAAFGLAAGGCPEGVPQVPPGAGAVARGVVGRPAVSADGSRFAFVRESSRELRTEILAVELSDGAWSAPRLLADEGTPDLVSISPDGRLVAFVAGAGGIASVFVVPFDGGAPVQLTNVGLRREGEGPPPAFVPIPLRDPPRFEGDRLVWTARDGAHEAVLP